MTTVRVAAHVHSSWSYDAEWSLAGHCPCVPATPVRCRAHVGARSRIRSAAVDGVPESLCMAASTDDILLVPGIEYEDADNVVHTPVWGENVPFLGAGRPTLELLRLAQAEGAVAVLAHPWRRNAISRYQPEWAPLLSAVEIWNRKYDGIAPHREIKKFADREGFAPFVSLDFHTSRQFFPLAMSVSLAERPSPVSLIEAIRGGRCRAEFLGFSALRFTGGLEGATLRALEAARRGVRGPLRRLQAAHH